MIDAVETGVPPTVVREALLMLVPFAGVPRCLDAMDVFAAALRELGSTTGERTTEALPASDGERTRLFAERGRRLFGEVYGADDERVLAGLAALDPELPGWVLEGAYGRVLARPGLTVADRECLAVVVLTALDLPRQLRGHLLGALRCGVPADDLRACLDGASASLPAGRLEDLLAQLDAASA